MAWLATEIAGDLFDCGGGPRPNSPAASLEANLNVARLCGGVVKDLLPLCRFFDEVRNGSADLFI